MPTTHVAFQELNFCQLCDHMTLFCHAHCPLNGETIRESIYIEQPCFVPWLSQKIQIIQIISGEIKGNPKVLELPFKENEDFVIRKFKQIYHSPLNLHL